MKKPFPRSKKPMFKPGEPFKSVHEIVEAIERGEWIFWHGRPKHPRFIACLTLETIMRYPTMFFRAERNK